MPLKTVLIATQQRAHSNAPLEALWFEAIDGEDVGDCFVGCAAKVGAKRLLAMTELGEFL